MNNKQQNSDVKIIHPKPKKELHFNSHEEMIAYYSKENETVLYNLLTEDGEFEIIDQKQLPEK